MRFFKRLYMDDYGLETIIFLKKIALFLLRMSITIFLITAVSFAFLIYIDMYTAAKTEIFVGLFFSVCTFISSLNLLAYTIIGNNSARIRKSCSVKKSKQKNRPVETALEKECNL